jgi:hypothetical protein
MQRLVSLKNALQPEVAGAVKGIWAIATEAMETSMLHTIFDNHLLLSALILIFLFAVPALMLRGRGLRDDSHSDRRSRRRSGADRRA